MRAHGIDVSRWNGKMNFAKTVSAGAEFVICKSSQFTEDTTFKSNWKMSKDAGLLRGAYHYLDWRKSELEQAKLFVDLLHNDPGELPPVADYEMHPELYGITNAVACGKLWNFVTYVERELKVTPMIYSGYYTWKEMGGTSIGWAKYPLWLPWYNREWIVRPPPPWKKWTYWQWTDRGNAAEFGSTGLNLDRNWFNGTSEELRKFANGTVSPVVPITGQYRVVTPTSKVFAGPGDAYKQVSRALPFGTEVTVLEVVTNTEKWAQIESPAGWTRFINLSQ
jgi:lysozyme